jgi:plastocyanin domain-containing protein
VTEQGFEPAKVTLHAGTPARLVLTRTTDKTCGTEVVFPSLGISRALPGNEPAIDVTPEKAGDIAFACGANMLKGVVVDSACPTPSTRCPKSLLTPSGNVFVFRWRSGR